MAFGVFDAEVGEAVLLALAHQRHAGVGGDCPRGAVVFVVLSPAGFDSASLGVVFKNEVQNAGDGVRTVLSGGAVAQDFHSFQSDVGNGSEVGALRAVGNAAAKECNDRSAMASFAVD